jgi:hypothetical protein
VTGTSTIAEQGASGSPSPDFTSEEWRSLHQEDHRAGRFLGVLLTVFFLVLVGLMAAVGVWTWQASQVTG